MDKEKEENFYKNLKFNLDDEMTKLVVRYINSFNLDEIDLSRFDMTLRHKNIETNLTDGIFALFIDSDGKLKYRVMDLMLNKEYVEIGKNITVECKILIVGELECALSKGNI